MNGPLRSSALATVVSALIIGCVAPQNALRLAPDAPADSVVFVLTNAEGNGTPQSWVYGLSVVACGTERSLWTIASDGATLPTRVKYGQQIPGFIVRAGPEPLVPGCYDVYISSARPLRFHVDATGAVREP